jgi:hypothetical protein
MSYNSHSTTITEGADSNASVLQETRVLQEESLEALRRIRCKTSESKALGNETLEALNDQTKQLESTEANTIELRSSLDKIGKLQDRFAKMTFRFGNQRKAKKELAREEKAKAKLKAKNKITTLKFKTGASPIKKESLISKEDEKISEANNPASSKRRGSHPKKQPAPGDPRENKNLVVEEPQNDSAGSNQKEIFANHDVTPIKKKKTKIPNSTAKKEHTKKKKKKTSTHNLPKDKEAATVPLSDQDQLELREIRDTDNFIDAGIDALGDEVAELLALSLTMGEVANHQNGKLETIDTNLETTGAQTNLLNKRVQLFTATTRRGR